MTQGLFKENFLRIVSDYDMGFITELCLYEQVLELFAQNKEHIPYFADYESRVYEFKCTMLDLSLSVLSGEQPEQDRIDRAKELRFSLDTPIQSMKIAYMSEQAWSEEEDYSLLNLELKY